MQRTYLQITCVTALMLLSILCTTKAFAATTHTPLLASGCDSTNTQSIIPADVLARVKLSSKELALIRKALGKPPVKQKIISVSNASPREVYFAAQALFKKANHLAYKVTNRLNIKNNLKETIEPDSTPHKGGFNLLKNPQ